MTRPGSDPEAENLDRQRGGGTREDEPAVLIPERLPGRTPMISSTMATIGRSLGAENTPMWG